MKTVTLFVVLFYAQIVTSAQVSTIVTWVEKNSQPAQNVVFYNLHNKLTWADFKGIPNLPDPVAAITASGFGYNVSMKTVNGKGAINVDVYCSFSKPNSWVKKGKNTAYILQHEQHHFDATYLAAVQFITNVKAAKLTMQNTSVVLANLYKQSCTYMNTLQLDYDTQTKNGQLTDKQAEWSTFFKEKLMKGIL